MPEVTPDPGRQEAAPLLASIAGRIAEGRGGDASAFGLDARLLLGMALGRDAAVFPHETVTLTDGHLGRLAELVDRRAGGEPVSRLRGWREFYSLRFAISPATLDPRPDSEILVGAAIDWLSSRPDRDGARVVDFGTGSGCLLLSVLRHCPGASGLGVDISEAAVGCASGNAAALGLAGRAEFRCASWDQGLEGRFDAVLSNPPYIPGPDMAGLMPEVRDHDPREALLGGADGLAAWREVLPAMARRLEPRGRGFVEIGRGQEDVVTAIAEDAGLRRADIREDLSGVARCLVFRHREGSRKKSKKSLE